MSIDRTDIPTEFANVVTVALSHGVIDMKELLALSATHQTDHRAFVNRVCEISYANSFGGGARGDANVAVCKAAEAFWRTLL